MWLWQLKKLNKNDKFFIELFIFSSFCHFILLFLVFFILKDQRSNLFVSLSLSKNIKDAKVVFLPLCKSSVVSKIQSGVVFKNSVNINIEKSETAKPKTFLLKDKKEELSKKIKNKEIIKKKEKNIEIKKTEKIKENIKKDINKVDKIENKKNDQKEVLKQDLKIDNKKELKKENIKSDLKIDEDIIYVGQAEMQSMQIQKEILQNISKNWSPPAGISKNVECTVFLSIDKFGKINDSKIVQTSGVLMFDISVRMSLLKTDMPKSIWGKEITICFKP